METMTRVSAVEAQVVASQVGASSDCYIPSGQVGKVDLRHGCFSAYEVFRLAARDIVESGEAAAVSAMLRARVKTVRQFLAERYQVFTGAREYYTQVLASNAHNPNNAFARPIARKKLAGR